MLLGGGTAVAAPKEGDKELQLAGGFFREIGSGASNLNVDGSLGYFFTPQWEAGVRQTFNYDEVSGASDEWYATTVPFLDFHLASWGNPDQPVVPFVGAFAGAVYNDDDITGTLGPDAGVKLYVSDSTFVAAKYRYEWFFEDFDEVDDTLNSHHVVSLGLGYNWQ